MSPRPTRRGLLGSIPRLDSVRGDTLRFVFREPPFLPGREWRSTLVRAE